MTKGERGYTMAFMRKETLTSKQIKRQDFVDNEIFDMINKLNPTERKIEWNIEFIAEVRDKIETILVSDLQLSQKQGFYPVIK